MILYITKNIGSSGHKFFEHLNLQSKLAPFSALNERFKFSAVTNIAFSIKKIMLLKSYCVNSSFVTDFKNFICQILLSYK